MKKFKNKKIDYDLLVQAEKVRYQSDFSSAHWLFQIICKYSEIKPCKLRDAYEKILRIAVKFGCKEALTHSKTYPEFLNFPQFLNLPEVGWDKTRKSILKNFDDYIQNRFSYLREGD